MALLLRRPFTLGGGSAPTGGVVPEASGDPVGSNPSGVATGAGRAESSFYSFAQQFTTVEAMSIDDFQIDLASYYPGTMEMGIATSLGANATQVAWVTDGTHLCKTAPFNMPNGGSSGVWRALPNRMLLPPGTYWWVENGTAGGGAANGFYAFGPNVFCEGALSSVNYRAGSMRVIERSNIARTWQVFSDVSGDSPDDDAAAMLWEMRYRA